MAATDGSYDAGVVAAQGTRAAQVADVAARIERLPLTSYQRGIFAILATAWFFASVDLGALTFDRGSTTQPFQLSTAEAGLRAFSEWLHSSYLIRFSCAYECPLVGQKRRFGPQPVTSGLYEAKLYRTANSTRRALLCPVLWVSRDECV